MRSENFSRVDREALGFLARYEVLSWVRCKRCNRIIPVDKVGEVKAAVKRHEAEFHVGEA